MASSLNVRVVSRSLVKASDTTIEPHVLAVSNLDLLPQTIQTSMFCVYPKPPIADFDAVVAAFQAGLPSLLNHFFLLAGRIATNPSSGLPEVHCYNQGAELVVGEAGVALAGLDYGNMSASLRWIQQPRGQDMALSVQVVSFACGGFTVSWCTNHVLVDGSALSSLVGAWSELARTGMLSAGARPNHDTMTAPPSYSASLNQAFTPLEGERQVNVLTRDHSVVKRNYYIEASDVARLREAASREGQRATRVAVSAYLWKTLARVVGTSDPHCRMGWWVDGRRRLMAPELLATMPNYVGNVITFAAREASVAEILRMPLPDVAAMVREAFMAPAYDQHFQELVDWVEEHKTKRYIETETLGLGSPAVCMSAFTSFGIDTDFGFGHAAMATPTCASATRLCAGLVQITVQPGVHGAWIVNAFLWPQLAAALEADEPRVFKLLTAEYLGLVAPKVQQSRL
ncbi:hypothetical protein EJB05_32259, partial [Eragrostis curvula]